MVLGVVLALAADGGERTRADGLSWLAVHPRAAVPSVAGLVAFASVLDAAEGLLWSQLAYQVAFAGYTPVAVGRLVAITSSASASRA